MNVCLLKVFGVVFLFKGIPEREVLMPGRGVRVQICLTGLFWDILRE
jgi:hypothetical protein